MRTMFISLVCILFLSQFAIAALIDIEDKECGEIYYCYVTEKCKNENKKDDPLSGLSVVEVVKGDQITDDCQALIRYHLYTASWAHVEIESFQKLDEVKSIEFKQIDDSNHLNIILKNKFSCFLNDTDNIIQAIHSKGTSNILIYESNATISEKLSCKFDIKTSRQTNIIARGGYVITMKINNDETNQGFILPLQEIAKCDPRQITFSHQHDETKLIEMVHSRPGHFYCTHNYQMEYRTDPNSNVFKPLSNEKIECYFSRYKIEGTRHPYIEARCSLDVSYSCDYNLKWSGKETKTSHTNPDAKVTPKVKTELKCPDDAPNLIIIADSGPPRQIIKPKFVCKHNGGEPYWAIGNERFTEEGPKVHCTNKLQCNLMIQENNVHDGDLGGNNLPKCFKDGTLKVGNEKVNKTWCDETSGDYKYTVHGRVDERIIDNSTIFECDYPKPDVESANAEVNKYIYTVSSIAGGVGIVLFIAIVVACVFHAKWQMRKMEKRQKRADDEANLNYEKLCADKPNGKDKQANKPAEQTEKSHAGEARRWNTFLMSFRYGSTFEVVRSEPANQIDEICPDILKLSLDPAMQSQPKPDLKSLKQITSKTVDVKTKQGPLVVCCGEAGKAFREVRINFLPKQKAVKKAQTPIDKKK